MTDEDAGPLPDVHALLVCDQAFQQAHTNEWHLIGIYDVVMARELPVAHAPFVVFCSLCGFRGEATVSVTIRDNVGEVVQAMRAAIPRLPGNRFELAFAFPPVEFQRAGSHTVELEIGGRLLTVRSFRVQLAA